MTFEHTERRDTGDRRRYSLQTLAGTVTLRRRVQGRRLEDRHFPIIDHFDFGVIAMALLLVLLSITDSVMTLTLIANGGREINPFMDLMLQQSVWLFAGVKMFLTAVPAVLLVATGNLKLFGRWRARSLLAALVGMYAGLILYELLLVSAIPPTASMQR